DGLGEDLVGDAVVVEVIDPEADGPGGVGAEIEVLADIAQDEVWFAVAIEIGDAEGLPPAVEAIEVGGQLCKMVAGELKDAGGHPVAGDDELVAAVAIQGGPAGGGDHADMGDIGVAGGGDIGKMAVAVVEVDGTGGVGAVFAGHGAAADEEVRVAIAVKIAGYGDVRIGAVGMGGDGIGGQGEAAVAVVEEEAVLHLAAIGGMTVAGGADEQIGVAVAIGVEEADGSVLEVGELVKGGLGRLEELAGRGLEIELTRVSWGAADKDIGETVAVDIGGIGPGSLAGEHFREVAFVKEIDVIVFLVPVEGGRDGLQEGSGTDGGWRSGTGLAAGLADGVELIGFGVTEGGDGAIGPGDDHGIGMVD